MELNDDELNEVTGGGPGGLSRSVYTVKCESVGGVCGYRRQFKSAQEAQEFILQIGNKCPFCGNGKFSIRVRSL